MKKIDATVKRETLYVLAVTFILSVLLQSIFLIIGKWNYTVLLGNLLSGSVAVLNFFLMGLTVQNAVTKEEKQAKTLMKASQTLRTLMQFIAAMVGVLLLDIFAAVIPLFFPRIAVSIRPLFDKNK